MSLFRFLFLLFSLNVLAACQSAGNVPPAENSGSAVTSPTSEITSQPKIPQQTTAYIIKEKPAPVSKVPPRIFPDTDVLKGATPDQLTALIGVPDFLRKDKPAEFWQYQSSICRLDLILYERKTNTNLAVDYFSVKALDGINVPKKIGAKSCLSSIIKQFETRRAIN